jgi:hypothetical protein
MICGICKRSRLYNNAGHMSKDGDSIPSDGRGSGYDWVEKVYGRHAVLVISPSAGQPLCTDSRRPAAAPLGKSASDKATGGDSWSMDLLQYSGP